jgi:hypothetical protein
MADLLYGVQKLSAFGFIVYSMLGMGLGLRLSAILAPLRDVRFVVRALVPERESKKPHKPHRES